MDKNQLSDILHGFLKEDVGTGDVTGNAIFSEHETGSLRFIAGGEFIAAGVGSVVATVFRLQNNSVITIDPVEDGVRTGDGMPLLTVSGPMVDLFKGEQVALNLLRHLSGIASRTASLVDRVKVYKVALTDSRETTPGLRMLERYAHRVGGGVNCRGSLADGVVLTKEHISACGSIHEAVQRVRRYAPVNQYIQAWTDLSLVKQCLNCGVDMLLLDDQMSLQEMVEAVKMARNVAKTEVRLGDNPDRLETLAMTGVDYISIGDFTDILPPCSVKTDWSF